MKRMLAPAGVILATAMMIGPSLAQEQTGKVEEIIIKIETPDGPRWYKLGADLSRIDIREGAIVRFNYADDTIDSIEVEEVKPGDAAPAE